MKRYQDAIELLSSVVKGADTELLLALAFAYLQTNDLNRCFLTCQKAIENADAADEDIGAARYSKDVLYGVGCEYYKLGECDVATFAFEQVLGLLGEASISPLKFDVTWRLALLARETNELDDCVQYLNAVVESPPPPLAVADVWVEMGCVRQEQGEEELAQDAFARAADLGADVTTAEYWHTLALKLEQVVVVPEHTRGTAAARTGARRAEAAIRRAIELAPDRAEAHLLLGCILYRADRNREAREVLRHSIELEPTLLEAWIKLGEACEALHRWPEAVEVYRSALRNLLPPGPRADDLWEHLDWLMTRLDYDYHVSYNRDPMGLTHDRPPSARLRLTDVLQPNLDGVPTWSAFGVSHQEPKPERSLLVEMTRDQMDALGVAINKAQSQDRAVKDIRLLDTLDGLKSKLVDDAAVATEIQKRPGSASKNRALLPLKPRASRRGAIGALPARKPRSRRVALSAVETTALQRAIDEAQAGLILQRKPTELDVHLDLIKAGLVESQLDTPARYFDVTAPRPHSARNRVRDKSDIRGGFEKDQEATKRILEEKSFLEEQLRLAAKRDETLRYKHKKWGGPAAIPKLPLAKAKVSRLALGDLARGDPGSAAVTLTLSPAGVKVLNAALQNAYADLCQDPLTQAVPLAHIDGLTVQLLQRQAAPKTRVIEGKLVRPRSATSKGHDGRDSLAPRLGLNRGAPNQYKNTTLRVTEAALPTLERVIAVAQSDFRNDPHALDIIDWIRAELMAGRGPAFKSEEAGGPRTAREPRRKNREAVPKKDLPKHVDGPEELKRRRLKRRMKRRGDYKKTAGESKKDEELALGLDSQADGVLLKAIEALRKTKEEQAEEIAGLRASLIAAAQKSEQLTKDLATAKTWAASMPSAEEVPKLQSDVLGLKQKLEDARLETNRLKQKLDERPPGTGGDSAPLELEDKAPAAAAARRPKVTGPADAPPPFMYDELQRKVAECKELLKMTNELRNELSRTKLQLFQEKDMGAAAKSSSDVRLENLEAQVLKLKGQVVEERQSVTEARRETQEANERARQADGMVVAAVDKAAKQKAMLDALPKRTDAPATKDDDNDDEDEAEDEFERLHREAEQTALAVAEVDLQGRLRAMGVALTETRKNFGNRDEEFGVLKKERDALLAVLAKHEMGFDQQATAQKELESLLAGSQHRETELQQQLSAEQAKVSEMTQEIIDSRAIVGPLRDKVDVMQQTITKLKDSERSLLDANEVLQQSALRKECDRMQEVQNQLIGVLGNRLEPSQHEFEEPTLHEVTEYAEYLGIDGNIDHQYLWIAREAMVAPIPDEWEMSAGEDGYPFFFKTGDPGSSTNEHPMDNSFRDLYRCLKWGVDPRKPLPKMGEADATATVQEEMERRRRLEGARGRGGGSRGRGRGRGRGNSRGSGGRAGAVTGPLALTDGTLALRGGRPGTAGSKLPIQELPPDQRRQLALELSALEGASP